MKRERERKRDKRERERERETEREREREREKETLPPDLKNDASIQSSRIRFNRRYQS
jgi:hypothetical protein